jgi:hypothetical protein
MPRIVLFDEIIAPADGYDIVFKAELTAEPPGLGEITDILLLCYVEFGQSVIALAAVGAASITGIGFTREIAVTALRAREIETINRNEGAIADFGARMRAESGTEAVLEFGLTSADG